jgi:sugar/nucleoside kinase (ribokinase family)
MPLSDVFDPTGAGDTFAGGFMGTLATAPTLDTHVLRRAMVMGSVMASFTVEKFSLERLKEISRSDLHARFAAFKRLTHFDDLPQQDA